LHNCIVSPHTSHGSGNVSARKAGLRSHLLRDRASVITFSALLPRGCETSPVSTIINVYVITEIREPIHRDTLNIRAVLYAHNCGSGVI